jgi:hypothetical protein
MASVCADDEAAGGGPGCGKPTDHLKPLALGSVRNRTILDRPEEGKTVESMVTFCSLIPDTYELLLS